LFSNSLISSKGHKTSFSCSAVPSTLEIIKRILAMSDLSNFFPNQILMVPWVRTMDTAEPLTSIETGSGLLPEELGM